MKNTIVIIFIVSNLLSGSLEISDDDFDLGDNKKYIHPMNSKQLEKYYPIILSMEDEAKKERKKKKDKIKVANNFTSKSKINKSKNLKTEINTDSINADFFNSLDTSDSKPINME